MAFAFAVSTELLSTLSGDMSILLPTITLDGGHISVLWFVLCNICSSYWIAGNSLLKNNELQDVPPHKEAHLDMY